MVSAVTRTRQSARAIAATVTDPELPMLTLADLGVLRDVRTERGGTVVVEITPTYSGCPAMGAMRADLVHALHRAGYADVDVRTVLAPPWSTDWITPEGKRKLAAVGIAPPPEARASAAPRHAGPIPLTLGRRPPSPGCPRCGSLDTQLTAQFSATACKSLHRCNACGEPFEAVKPI